MANPTELNTAADEFISDTENFRDLIVGDWSASRDYEVGHLAKYDNKIWYVKNAITGIATNLNPETDTTNWGEVEANSLKNKLAFQNLLWDGLVDYVLNDLVIHNGKIYRCKVPRIGDASNSNPATDTGTWEIIESGDVDTDELVDGAVDTDKIADGAVTNAKLRDGTILESKLSSSLRTTISGSATVVKKDLLSHFTGGPAAPGKPILFDLVFDGGSWEVGTYIANVHNGSRTENLLTLNGIYANVFNLLGANLGDTIEALVCFNFIKRDLNDVTSKHPAVKLTMAGSSVITPSNITNASPINISLGWTALTTGATLRIDTGTNASSSSGYTNPPKHTQLSLIHI